MTEGGISMGKFLGQLILSLIVGALVFCLFLVAGLFLTITSNNKEVGQSVWTISYFLGLVAFGLTAWFQWRCGRDRQGCRF